MYNICTYCHSGVKVWLWWHGWGSCELCRENINLLSNTGPHYFLLVSCSVCDRPKVKFMHSSNQREEKKKILSHIAELSHPYMTEPHFQLQCIFNWYTSITGHQHLVVCLPPAKSLQESKLHPWITNNTYICIYYIYVSMYVTVSGMVRKGVQPVNVCIKTLTSTLA